MQTIKAAKGNEIIKFELNYRTSKARIVTAAGAERTTLEAALKHLHSLPEQGWICR